MKKDYFLSGKIKLSVLACFCFINISAQEITGTLECRFLNEDDNPVVKVILEVTSPSLQGIRSAESNSDGYIRISLLPPGYYTANISHLSYSKITIDSIRIRLGKTNNLGRLKLESQPVEIQEVLVTDRRNLIDHTTTVTGANFSLQEIEPLPLQRNFQTIPLLLPQINSSFYGDDISYSGTTGLENRILIDGIESTEPIWFRRGTALPYNFIRDIEVVSGGYEAQYRSSLGGIVNAMTQVGGDKFSGQVFGFYTSNRFSADFRSAPGKDPDEGDYSLYDIGINIRGPIIKEKLWLNAAYNPNFQNEDVTIPGIGTKTDKVISHQVAGKLSWCITEKAQLIFNFSGEFYDADRVRVWVPPGLESYLNPDPALGKLVVDNYSPSIRAIYFITNKFFLEGSISRFHIKFSYQPATEIGKQPIFYDYLNRTISGGAPDTYNERATRLSSQIKATLSFNDHIVKAGIEYLDNTLNRNRDVYSVSKFSDSLYYSYILYQHGMVGNRIPSVYLQDSWKINPNWQINAGVRWEGQYIIGSDGRVAQKILDQIQPRLGVIFSPDQYGTHKLFVSYGRFYQELADLVIAYYYLKDIVGVRRQYDHDPRENAAGGDTIFAFSNQIQKEISGFKGQYSDEFSLGYENRVLNHYKFTIRGVYRTLGEGTEDAFSENWQEFVLGNPSRYPLAEYPQMTRNYLALELTFQKVYSDPFNFFISYVLSRNYGNYQGLFDSENGSFAGNFTTTFDYLEMVEKSTGLLPYDRTHSIKFNGSYRFDFGLSIGATFSWISGTPLNEYGVGTENHSRIFLKPRGTAGRTPSIWDINLRLAYDLPSFSLINYNARLIVDVFHIASRKEPVTYDQIHYLGVDENGTQILPNPTYGQPTRYFPPMSLRIGMEVNF
jgi:hypothetical protein